MKKIVRITTVPISLHKLLTGQLKFINSHFDVIAISSEGKEWEKIIKYEGVRSYKVNMTRKITPLKDIISVIRLFLILKKEKPYIVHSHTPKAGLVSMIAAFLAKVPNRLHTVAGLPLMETSGLKYTMLKYIEKFTYKLATNVYPNSENLKKYIISNKICQEKKLKVISKGSSNGIDLNYFKKDQAIKESKDTIKNELKISKNDKVFCYVGRLVKDKGVNELVEAFDRFKNDNIKLILVGKYEEDLAPLLKTTLNTINSNKNIIITGWQEDIRPYLAMSDIFVFPSYREGFPNVLLQACSFDLPCITTNINGCNEIISNNKNGLLIKKKDVNELYLAMEKLFLNNELRENLSKNRSFIKDNFERQTFHNMILQEYLKL